jgi:high affinity sulfate transporter 1
MPGLPEIVGYDRAFLKSDAAAGLSVAAIALPTGIAYAELAGFSPVIGLYSTIMPMIVYAFFGSSRQLIVGPDAATCAMITASLTPLIALSENVNEAAAYYHALAVSLTLFTGVLCIVAARFRLGFLAELLSRPILMGLLNGVALTIIIGQLGKLIGVTTSGKDNISLLISFFFNLSNTHLPTLLLTLMLFFLYLVLRRKLPMIPIALTLAVAATLAGYLVDLEAWHVMTVGEIPASLPTLHFPAFPHESWGTILPAAGALAFISFGSATLTARSFAAKNGYEIDSNRELTALGAANIASALSQGFAISGADSRTAVNDAAGGKTRMAQIIAALAILVALLLFAAPLSHMPVAALGVILVISAVSLTDFATMKKLYTISRTEFHIALATFLAVVLIGVMPGILLAVCLAVLSFLMKTARPMDHKLGLMQTQRDFMEIDHYPDAKEVDHLLIYRFEASLIFINASYFRARVTELIESASTPVYWVIIDARSMNNIDLTGAAALYDLSRVLEAKGITIALAGRSEQFTKWMALHSLNQDTIKIRFFPDRHLAYDAFLEDLNVHQGFAQK